jgi:hypothetical protein
MEMGAFPFELDLFLSGYDGPAWATEPFRHRSGWLMLSEARMMTAFGEHRRHLVAAVSDNGESYLPHVAARLLDMPASRPRDAESYPPAELDDATDAAYWDFLGTVDLQCLGQLTEKQEAVERRIALFEADCAAFEKKIAQTVRDLRAERRRGGLTVASAADIDAQLARLSDMPGELAMGMRRKTETLRHETDDLELAVMEGLTDHGDVMQLCIIRWCARSRGWRSADVRLPSPRPLRFVADAFMAAVDGRTLESVAAMRIFRNEQEE